MKSLTDPSQALTIGLSKIRTEFHVPDGFPAEVLAAAEKASRRVPDQHTDRTAVAFVTLDPATSTDLDQAFSIEASGGDLLLHYAIADVAWFVEDGDAVDVEAWARGETLYLPNGNPIDDPVKFPYKLSWMARLERWAAERLALEEALVLAGDYNVIPERIDAMFPDNWLGDALFQPQTRQAFRRLQNLGFTEAVRAVTDQPETFTFWDYQAGAWQKNNGIRIDHLLLSPEAANRFSSASIEKHVRAWEKPSDHVPVAIELDLAAA